jgi:4a-hydroxytetrahydrobiopterin dehydratase
MTTLASEHCVACRSDVPSVTPEEQATLHASIPDWSITERDGIPQIERVFRFKSYRDALAFVQRVGDLADAEDHHPTVLVEWRKVTVTWWTHTIKGLHRNDFVMAAKTDAVATQ